MRESVEYQGGLYQWLMLMGLVCRILQRIHIMYLRECRNDPALISWTIIILYFAGKSIVSYAQKESRTKQIDELEIPSI